MEEKAEKVEERREVGEVESLRKALEEERARAESYLANWQRAQADYLNLKKQTQQEKEEIKRFANAQLILSILPAIDDLERAFNSLPEKLLQLSWIEGIRLIYRKMIAILQAYGLSEIEAEGKPFDPHYHEVIMYSEGEENKVVGVVQKGYKLHDRVLRPALVIVGRGKKEGEHGEGSGN